jgi:hypothetical protein
MRDILHATLLAALAVCCTMAGAAPSLEQEKLKLLSCVTQGVDTPARRAALAWHRALLQSADKGAKALSGPLWLGGACVKQVSLDVAGAAGMLCEGKPEAFAAALKDAGVVLESGAEAAQKQALLFQDSQQHLYLLVEGVFGPMMSVSPQPGTYSFFCAVGPKQP